MQKATVIIPNLNGIKYLRPCLDSLARQSIKSFSVILVDNGSKDGSVEFVRERYPQVIVRQFDKNVGFCRAVNEGIRMADTPYVILLNNDTICDEHFVEELILAIDRTGAFSCAAKMVMKSDPSLIDNAGDYYCALGWGFAFGKGKNAGNYDRERKIFSACAAAAIYRREVFDKIGLFDEAHFAYLEDMDVGYRARIAGYRNYYAPKAVVLHEGSATSGSRYNSFKIRLSSRNNVYMIYKNMPWMQILLNLPFLLAGFAIKTVFYAYRGFVREYVSGLASSLMLCRSGRKIKFQWKNFSSYIRIQIELWVNLFRRLR